MLGNWELRDDKQWSAGGKGKNKVPWVLDGLANMDLGMAHKKYSVVPGFERSSGFRWTFLFSTSWNSVWDIIWWVVF